MLATSTQTKNDSKAWFNISSNNWTICARQWWCYAIQHVRNFHRLLLLAKLFIDLILFVCNYRQWCTEARITLYSFTHCETIKWRSLAQREHNEQQQQQHTDGVLASNIQIEYFQWDNVHSFSSNWICFPLLFKRMLTCKDFGAHHMDYIKFRKSTSTATETEPLKPVATMFPVKCHCVQIFWSYHQLYHILD